MHQHRLSTDLRARRAGAMRFRFPQRQKPAMRLAMIKRATYCPTRRRRICAWRPCTF